MRLSRTLRRPLLVAAAAGIVGAVAGCGASSSGPGSSASSVSVTPPAQGCGSFAAAPPKDPDGVFASLPKEQRDALNLWPVIRKSAWANFKPSHAPPYSVGIVVAGGVDPLQTTIFRELKSQLKASPMIGKVSFYSTGKGIDVPQQLRLYGQVLQQKPDIIIAEPLQPEAFVGLEAKAGKAGIPTVNFLGDVDSPYGMNINNNSGLGGAVLASWMLRSLKGAGNVLFVHGFPGTSADTGEFNGLKAVLSRCPKAKLAGEVIGGFVNGAAKQETLKFLATHPTALGGVMQAGGMGPGVISAFTSTGRPVPVLGDIGAVQGSLVYWKKHLKTYHAIGFGQPAKWTATAAVSVVLRTLGGQGPLINTFAPPTPLIDESNLDEWVDASASTRSDEAAEGPRDAFLSEAYLNGLFAHGKPPQ